jgi:hypothetical protein
MLTPISWLLVAGALTDPCQISSNATPNVDILHPRYFVNVTEHTGERRIARPLLRALAGSPGDTILSAVSTVDRNSIISISFPRNSLRYTPEFGANLAITAALNGQPIEVPGYSMVGEQAGEGAVTITPTGPVYRSMCALDVRIVSLRQASRLLRDSLSAALADQRQRVAGWRQLPDSISNLDARIAELTQQLTTVTQNERLELEQRKRVAESDRQAALDARAKMDTAFAYRAVALRESYRLALDGVRGELNGLLSGLPARGLEVLEHQESGAQQAILAMRDVLSSPTLTSIGTIPTVGADGGAAASRELVNLESLVATLDRFDPEVDRYASSLQAMNSSATVPQLSDLMDTQVDLGAIEAKPGDRFSLSFVNQYPDSAQRRKFDLNLRVRRFGLVSDIDDSFIFLRRQRANYRRVPLAVTRDTATLAPGATRQIDVPVGVNYQLTPGAALTWSYLTRNRHSFWNWLRPGFGIQVSFPKFETATYTISRPPSGESGSPNPVSITQETRSNNFDIATGGILTLFDNSIGISMGYDLMARDANSYVGFTVSFVSLAKKAAQLIPAGQ